MIGSFRTPWVIALAGGLLACTGMGGRGVSDAGDCFFSPPAVSVVARLGDTPLASRAPNPARHYPDRAWRLEVGGEAIVRCTLNEGVVVACDLVSEHRGGFDFGRAAQQTAGDFIYPLGLTTAEVTIAFRITQSSRTVWNTAEPGMVSCDGPWPIPGA